MSNAPYRSDSSPTTPGSVLAGKYRVERILGQGGMGVVVEARHIALDERVALKFLLPEYAKHPEASARFLREARAAVKIKSEHVARVSDVGTLELGVPYMVMEFLQGRDLSQVLEEQGVLRFPDAVDYVIQGCEAIAEAHSYGIVHRDLKPANLFLSKRPDGTPIVKVLDFGISKVMGGGVDNLTKTTAAMGSALYMSPEQMQQTRSVDHRTDIYALGISLYELLAGKQPFYADTLPQLCAEILTGIPTPLRTLRADVPEALASVIERAYARDRAQRFQSIAEFVVALAPFAPPQSQNSIERVARLGGIPIPPPASGVFATPARDAAAPATRPPGGYPTVPLPVMDPTKGIGAPPGAPPLAPPATSPPTQPSLPNHPVQPAGQVTSPLGPPDLQSPAARPGPPAPGQIVLGPYSGPMSVRAAASFAQGGTTNAPLATTGQTAGESKIRLFVVAVIALLAFGGIGAAVAIRFFAPKPVASSPLPPSPPAPATAVAQPVAPPPPSPDPTPPPQPAPAGALDAGAKPTEAAVVAPTAAKPLPGAHTLVRSPLPPPLPPPLPVPPPVDRSHDPPKRPDLTQPL